MTSCSLQLSGDAETVLAADDCRREPHDYAGSSFFGRRGPHPEMEHGRTVLAATVRVGRGRIAAFTDSTVWSSFAVFSHDREKLAMDLVRLLNREPSPYELPIRGAGARRRADRRVRGAEDGRSDMALPAVLVGLAGVLVGPAASEGLHRGIYAWPEPNDPGLRGDVPVARGRLRISAGARDRPTRCRPIAASTRCSCRFSDSDWSRGSPTRTTRICSSPRRARCS